jgi:hypothetical protein
MRFMWQLLKLCCGLYIDNYMSSNLTIPNHTFRTPQLKRTVDELQASRMSSRLPAELPIHSRFQKLSSYLSESRPSIAKSRVL